ncbi:helix-turn-helix domain-containing protein [Tessaracoccus sp. Z1128]
MISASGAPIKDRERSLHVPFALAFGFALATSSAVGATLPALPYTATAVRPFVQASALDSSALTDHTSSGLLEPYGPYSDEVSASPAQKIAELRALTGLTTDQVSRLFGVSRRSVHNWISGNAMSPLHEELAAKILAIVQVVPGSTPAERRAAMLDSSRGTSLFHQLVAARGEDMQLQVAGVSPRERIEL